MVSSTGQDPPSTADFLLEKWLVQPSLNRLTRKEKVVQLEPKLMDVLVFLADHAGEVVSKIDITDAVWPDVFITESVITRSIAGLRRAFGDDVRNPSFIETISKRGYRLIAEVTRGHSTPGTTRPAPRPGPRPSTGPSIPFVVGQWVRGEDFYGRSAIIEEVLHGNRNWVWLLGTRRIGKTSVLKQLELTAMENPDLGFVPVFWDLQGADEPQELHLDFAEALLDAEDRLAACGIPVSEVRADDCFESLGRLRRKLLSQNRRLLLMCDEVEELLQLNQKDPSVLRKFRKALQSSEGIRSVLAASGRLWQLANPDEDTSPFLDGFTPPLCVGPLSDEEADALIRQDQLPKGSRPSFTPIETTRIRTLAGNHPYLTQMLCRRLLDRGDLDVAVEELTTDRAVGFFFSVDFELLSELERGVIRFLACQEGATFEALHKEIGESRQALAECVVGLSKLGLIETTDEDRHEIASTFFLRWLQNL